MFHFYFPCFLFISHVTIFSLRPDNTVNIPVVSQFFLIPPLILKLVFPMLFSHCRMDLQNSLFLRIKIFLHVEDCHSDLPRRADFGGLLKKCMPAPKYSSAGGCLHWNKWSFLLGGSTSVASHCPPYHYFIQTQQQIIACLWAPFSNTF